MLLAFQSHLLSLQMRIWCWTNSQPSLNLLSLSTWGNLFNIYETGRWKVVWQAPLILKWASKHFQRTLALIHRASPKLPYGRLQVEMTAISLPHGLSTVSPKVELYTLFCSCPSMWRIISHLREWVSSKCSTAEHSKRNIAKSKLCNWVLRGWLGIADLAVIKTTLFTLVLHHYYSKTAD